MGMTEYPIIFSGPMVRALLERRKAQARRLVKPQPAHTPGGNWHWKRTKHRMIIGDTPELLAKHMMPFCPYGVAGDHLWVRETWGVFSRICGGRLSSFPGCWLGLQYRASEEQPLEPKEDDRYVKVSRDDWNRYREPGLWKKWQSPVAMPRRFSRLTAERKTNRPPERLQEISHADAVAEGHDATKGEGTRTANFPCEQGLFRTFWNNRYGHRGHGWDVNDWVWVPDFEVIDG